MSRERIVIPGGCQAELAGLIDLPDSTPSTNALFVHCFTCGKESIAAARIARALATAGIACLRFDMTGLGDSRGDFSKTTLSTNISDLIAAAKYLRVQDTPAKLLIGHSLGGVAAVLAANKLPELRAIVLINVPPQTTHLLNHFGDILAVIEEKGSAKVPIYDVTGKRQFLIRREFIEDLKKHDFAKALATLNLPLLILYSENDDLITAKETQAIYQKAAFPKQLITLKGADHILSNRDTGLLAGNAIAEWFKLLK